MAKKENAKRFEDSVKESKIKAADEAAAEETKKTRGKDKKDKKKRPKWMKWAIAATAIVLVAAIVIVILNSSPTGVSYRIGKDIQTPEYIQGDVMNILICGIDYDETRTMYQTDVIMVVNFDKKGDKATVLQIPRDTYVGEDLVHLGKINGLYNWGFKDDPASDLPAGPGPLIETIYDQFQLPIDRYVMITMEGFRKAVDMLGGVEVTLTEPIKFSDDYTLEAGTHLLNGEQADLFVRFRGYAQADIARLEAQRLFMSGLLKKLFGMSKTQMASIGLDLFEYLETNLTYQELFALAEEAQQLSTESISFIRTPGEPVSRYGIYGVDVFTMHKEDLAKQLNDNMRAYMDPVPAYKLNVIELQNTTDMLNEDPVTVGELEGGEPAA